MSPNGLYLLHYFPLGLSIRFCASTSSSQQVASKDGWIRVWIGMTGGLAKYWFIPRVGGQGTASCRSFNWPLAVSPFFMFLCSYVKFGGHQKKRSPSWIFKWHVRQICWVDPWKPLCQNWGLYHILHNSCDYLLLSAPLSTADQFFFIKTNNIPSEDTQP